MTAVLNCIPVAAIKMISLFFLWFEQQTKPELTCLSLDSFMKKGEVSQNNLDL